MTVREYSTRKSILVTGGAGFLGSHLIDRLLAGGGEVVCADNLFTGTKRNIEHLHGHPRFEFIRRDVTFPLYIEVDEIWNLACPASPVQYQHDPVQTTKTSVHGAINMLGLAKRRRCRIFQASTSEVYGDPSIHPQPESYWGNVNPIGPRSCYDESKRCAETLFFDYHRQHGTDIKVARIFNTYGPRMHPNDGRVVSTFIVQALKGEPITIYGEGKQTRSFCYMDDMIEGLLRLMGTEAGFTGPVNLGNPDEFTIRKLAEEVIELTGSSSKLLFHPLPTDDPMQRQPDISLARQKLGWEPKGSIEGRAAPYHCLLRRTALGGAMSRAFHMAVVNSHPIQYFAPLYAFLNRDPVLAVTALYCSGFSLRGAIDPGFKQAVTWDVDPANGVPVRLPWRERQAAYPRWFLVIDLPAGMARDPQWPLRRSIAAWVQLCRECSCSAGCKNKGFARADAFGDSSGSAAEGMEALDSGCSAIYRLLLRGCVPRHRHRQSGLLPCAGGARRRCYVHSPGSWPNMLDRSPLQMMALGVPVVQPLIMSRLGDVARPLPGVHYVQCADDFSDIKPVIGWVDDHPDECRTIGEAAKRLFREQAMPGPTWDRVLRRIAGAGT